MHSTIFSKFEKNAIILLSIIILSIIIYTHEFHFQQAFIWYTIHFSVICLLTFAPPRKTFLTHPYISAKKPGLKGLKNTKFQKTRPNFVQDINQLYAKRNFYTPCDYIWLFYSVFFKEEVLFEAIQDRFSIFFPPKMAMSARHVYNKHFRSEEPARWSSLFREQIIQICF